MNTIKFANGKNIPIEMHKTRIVQKLRLPNIHERFDALQAAGNNLYLLDNRDVFLDMLTDSGVNAMSDNQLAAMMNADDAYAGSRTFFELKAKVQELFKMDYFLPAHQGRACENIIATALIKPGHVIPMNYHFTTTKAHIVKNGGTVVEVLIDEGTQTNSTFPFKGNVDLKKLKEVIERETAEKIPFVRIEAGTNLIGGQPISLTNMREVATLCKEHNIFLIMDASLLQDNLYFIKLREFPEKSIREITHEVAELFDIIYFSARKLGFAKGGGISLRHQHHFDLMQELIPLYEGFLTYGGMSIREMGALTIGLEETMDEEIISQGPQFIEYMVQELIKHDVPVVTPAGGLGCHIDASRFIDHLPQQEYPAAALSNAIYLVSGIRTMERGTMSEDRNLDGSEKFAEMELVRCAIPRRVYTLSHIDYAIDRIVWLYHHRHLIQGLQFIKEPKTLRFFTGTLESTSSWQENLVNEFVKDFGETN